MFLWPYVMVAMIFALGSIYGSIEEYSLRMQVSNPATYLLASSVIAMASLYILDAVAGFVLHTRWLGTLPYIVLSPIKTPILLMIAGLPESIISTFISITAVLPAMIYFEGINGAIKVLLVLLVVIAGMMPMLGFSALIGSALLIVKEESNIFSSISPFILLISGIFYPLEVLPRILQIAARAVPVTYVVEATKLITTYLVPRAALLFLALYGIGALTVLYNALAVMALKGAERAVKSRGVL